MSVNIFWDNPEKTVIYQQYEGDVNADDFIYAVNRVFHMVENVSHTVHMIYDRTQVTSTPAHMSRILQYAGKHITPNMGLLLVVGANHTTRMVIQLGKAVAPELMRRVRLVDSASEAREFIQSLDNREARA